MESFDVIVIGGGPGGYTSAIRLAQLGKKVAVVERDRIGGTCLNYGCIPTKALLHASEILHEWKNYSRMGINFQKPEVDIERLKSWKKRVVEKLVKGVELLFREYGITVYEGLGFLKEFGSIEIEVKGGRETIKAKNIVIATGSEPIILKGFEPDGKNVITSREALELDVIPGRFLIIGAGAIGLEMATIYNSLGSKVVIVELMDQILPGVDREMAQTLQKILNKRGIEIHLKAKAKEIIRDEPVKLIAEIDGRERVFETDRILLSVGRRPTYRGIDVDGIGIEVDERGFIKVNYQQETSVPGIFAIGDVARPPLLAHKAMKEGIIAAQVIAGDEGAYDFNSIPLCVYTHPELASVGLSEEEARAKGYRIKVGRFPFSASGRASTLGKIDGFVKIIADEESDLLLGVHILGPSASDMIGEAVLALEMGARSEDIASAVHPHPTLSETIMEAAENLKEKAIHILNR
jgi:dihydrolipoamide dehydrogenase